MEPGRTGVEPQRRNTLCIGGTNMEDVGPTRMSSVWLDVKVNSVGTVHVNTMYKVTSSNFLPVTAGRHSLTKTQNKKNK